MYYVRLVLSECNNTPSQIRIPKLAFDKNKDIRTELRHSKMKEANLPKHEQINRTTAAHGSSELRRLKYCAYYVKLITIGA